MISSEMMIIQFISFRNKPMIIKLSKAEVKDRFKDGRYLQITLNESGNIYTTKSPRRIRQRVANFYGEAIQLPLSKNPIMFSIDQIDQKGEKIKIMEFCFECEQIKTKQINHDIMINENESLKLFWSWHIQVPESQMSSQFSRDIMNIETPKKADASEWNDMLRTYSPDHKKKHNLCKLFLDESMSDKCDSSPQTNKRLNAKPQNKQLTLLKLTSLVKSKSAATRSKTPSKPDLPVKTKASHNKNVENNKIPKQYKNKTTNISPQKKVRKISSQKKNSYNINKVGAALVSTVGIFAGLFAGMAASSI